MSAYRYGAWFAAGRAHSGRHGRTGMVVHAVHPEAQRDHREDGDYAVSLCGNIMVRLDAGSRFLGWHGGRACRSCTRLWELRKPASALQTLEEVSTPVTAS